MYCLILFPTIALVALFIVSIFLAASVAAFITSRLTDSRSRWHVADIPNERSLHTMPTPRTGGLAILAGVGVGMATLSISTFTSQGIWVGLALAAVAVVSYWDDRYGADVAIRLFVHLGAVLLLLQGGIAIVAFAVPGAIFQLSPWLGVAFTVVFLLWMINLYNFMDGMDGLAAGMAVFGFAFIALLAASAHAPLFAIAAGIVAAANFGFLIFNFAPARIFMGDVGSASLGLLAGVFSVVGAQRHLFPLWVALLIFSPFIVDATVTLVRRTLRGEPVWQAHRTHYYQRLVQMGWGHRKTALYAYALMAACGISALIAVRLPPLGQWTALGAWAIAYAVLARWINARAH